NYSAQIQRNRIGVGRTREPHELSSRLVLQAPTGKRDVRFNFRHYIHFNDGASGYAPSSGCAPDPATNRQCVIRVNIAEVRGCASVSCVHKVARPRGLVARHERQSHREGHHVLTGFVTGLSEMRAYRADASSLVTEQRTLFPDTVISTVTAGGVR